MVDIPVTAPAVEISHAEVFIARVERYEQMFQNGVAEAMGLKTSRPFANKPVQMIPRKR